MRLSSEEIDRQAALWVARVSAGDLPSDEQAEFDSWLAADLRHLGAYARIEASLARLGRLRAVGTGPVRVNSVSWTPTLSRRRTLLIGGAAAGLLAASLIGVVVWDHQPQETFTTTIGETRVVSLADGSVVTLNTNSRMSVSYSQSVRNIHLEQGEALFKVAKNKNRPFIVSASDTEVRAVGTSFSVRVLPETPVQILVQEGIVEVKRRDTPSGKAVRAVAETKTVVPAGAPIVVHAVSRPQLARNLVWQFGRIAFENETLGGASVEFARYSNTRIVVDPAVADRTITGLFDANDPVGFARVAASILDLHVEVEPEEVRIVR